MSHRNFIRTMCACVLSPFSHVRLSVTLWTVACQPPLSVGILQARILEWAVMPSSRDLPNPGIEPVSIPLIGNRVLYH